MADALAAEFINLEIYALYTAITELCPQQGWAIMWRSGELAFAQLEPTLDFPSDAPLDVLRTLGDYLVRVGYLDAIELELRPGGQLEYSMLGAAIRPAAQRLLDEGAILPHWSTALMVAALRTRCGVEARMEAHDHRPELVSADRSRERWLLTRDGVPIA